MMAMRSCSNVSPAAITFPVMGPQATIPVGPTMYEPVSSGSRYTCTSTTSPGPRTWVAEAMPTAPSVGAAPPPRTSPACA